jgi:hypothetical protein
MTPDQRFSLTLAALTLLFLVLSAAFGLLIKIGRNYGQMTERQAVMGAEQLRMSGELARIALGLDQRILWLERERRSGQPPW